MTDDLTIVVKGSTAISGWTDLRLTRGIERIPSDFDVGLTERYPTQAGEVPISPGDAIVVRLGGDTVLTGYVDRYFGELSPDRHSVRITGRSNCQDLVDCSAAIDQSTMTGTVMSVAEQLCKPYGITVSNQAPSAGASNTFAVNLGETPYEIIERWARYAQLLAYDDPGGNLVLAQVGSQRMSSGFAQGQNVQAASVNLSVDGRYHDYKVVWQSVAAAATEQGVNNLAGHRVDPAIRPARLLYIVSEQYLPGLDLGNARAVWEKNRRYGRSQAIRLTTDSWRDGAGRLWQPNALVSVNVPALKVANQNWIISEVTYSRSSETGTTADLVLMPPEAFSVLQTVPPNNLRDVTGGAPT